MMSKQHPTPELHSPESAQLTASVADPTGAEPIPSLAVNEPGGEQGTLRRSPGRKRFASSLSLWQRSLWDCASGNRSPPLASLGWLAS